MVELAVILDTLSAVKMLEQKCNNTTHKITQFCEQKMHPHWFECIRKYTGCLHTNETESISINK